MHEFMLNIDNKEILTEVLHHSIDFLIGSCKDNSAVAKSSHKYGFANPEEFESAIQLISNAIKLYTLTMSSEIEFLAQFSQMNQDLQQSILDAVHARKPEIVQFLLREYNSRENKLVQSFDWDVRLILGDNYNPSLKTQVATVAFNLLDSSNVKKPKTNTLTFEMDKAILNQFIQQLENADKILNNPNQIQTEETM